ncbi:MAG: alpha/beta hydrolase [Betaproteobacteria bacterium]|nr:alpha/beta hydrolase [Betaproteobacteria bacterium]
MNQPRLQHVQCLNPRGLHRMAYWEWGDPLNPRVLLCVHGLTRQGRDFDVLAQALCAHYRVVCPDVVGRGESDWLPDPRGYAVPTYVADMVTLLARLNAQSLDWVGTSMGGLIGMGVASLPGSPIRRLVLNDVGPRMELAALQRIGQYLGLPLRWNSFEEAAEALRLLTLGFGPHTREQWHALTRPQLHQEADGRWALRYDPGIAEPFKQLDPELVAAGQAQLWQAWDRIQAPTLVLRGALSDLLTPETLEDMSRRGPELQVRVFDGVGHAPTLVAPDQVEAVCQFLLA